MKLLLPILARSHIPNRLTLTGVASHLSSALFIALAMLLPSSSAFASNDIWIGNATTANWSDANWSSPVNPSGDFLTFGTAGTSGAALNNDLSGYSFAGIAFTNIASAYTIGGNAFSLTGGITNSYTAAQVINNNITLAGSQPVNAASGNLTLGGVIDDGGNGYGLTLLGGHTVNLGGVNTYSGATTNLAGTLAFVGAGSVSNSSIVLGKTGSTTGAYLTVGSAAQPAGITVFASNLVVNASILGGNNFNNLNTAGSANGSVLNQFSGALILNSGLLRASLAPNASGFMEFLFNNFSRSPGTAFSMDRTATAPGTSPIQSSSATASIVFTVPPVLLGTGTAGTTSNGIVQGVTIAYGPATYDSTYGLRALFSPTAATPEQVNLTSLTNVATYVPGLNALATAATTIFADTEVNSLQLNNSFTITLGGHTLKVDGGYVSSSVNGNIGSTANDGFLALGSEGFFDVANARTLTVNSCITGTNGLTINLDDLNGTSANCALNGTNTFTGITRILANQTMTVKLNNGLALQNSTLDYNNYGGTITFNGPTSFTFGGLEGAQNLAVAVPLTLGGDGDSTTYSGVLSGAGSIIKTGSGAFTLVGANTYSGGTTISNGVLNINNGGNSSANSAIGTAALNIAGGTIDNTSGSTVTLLPNNAQNWNGDFTFAGSSSLNLGTGLVALGGNRQVTVSANTLTVGGAISGVGFSLTKNGNGTLALSGANTYSGNTTVSRGTLALTGNGFIGNSPSITVSNGAALDVSGLSSTFTLGSSQSLYGSGTINGSVGTTSGSQIYADAGTAYGTNTFNNDLTLASGAAVNFQIGAVASEANDLIAVGGNLTLNGNTIKISAPSSSVNLDTADYTLFTVNGTISGSCAVSPTWVVQPLNFGNYSIVTSGNTVKLHYSNIINPAGTGFASPNPVNRNQNTVITVTDTISGSAPVSTVTLDATPIGGAPSVFLVEVGASNVYTNTVTVGSSAPAGSTPLTATITDTDGGSASVTVPLTVLAGTVTWNGLSGSDDNWSDTANWVGGISPLSGDAATFAGTTRLTPLMDNSFSLSSLTFSNNAGSFVITNATGSLLTLIGGGVTNNSANSQTLNVPIVMSAPQTFSTTSGSITLGGVVSGASSLTKVGAGINVLTLAGTNTYGGGTMVSAGTIAVANDSALGSGVLTLAGGSISNVAGSSYSIPNNVTVSSPGNAGVGSGDTLKLSGTISGGGTLTKIGNGSLILPSANDISGGVTVGAGTLVVGNNSALGSGLLTLGNGSISNFAGSSYSVGNTVNLTGTANVIVGSGDTFTLSGLITNTGSLNLVGAGTLNIPGVNANTYSGDTVLNGGTSLIIGNTSASPLGSGTLTFAGGTLGDNGTASVTINNNITALTNTTTSLNPTTFNGVGMTLAGNISGPGNIVVLGNAGNFDSFILSGDNSGFTGTLTVNSGGDQRFGFGSPSAGSANAAFVLNSAGTDEQKITFGSGTISFGSLSGSGYIRSDAAGTSIFSIGGLNTDSTFSGIIFANGGSIIGVLKVGTGTFTLSGADTYTGPTTVSNGTLMVNGSISGGGAVSVMTSATLGGSGTIAGAATVNSGGNTLPGGSLTNTTGMTTTFSGNLTYSAGAEADFNLGGTYSSGNDQINVGGTLNGNGAAVGINLTAVNLDTTGDYVLFNGTVAGGFASQPKWTGLTPTNAANFSVVNTGGQVLLHYSPFVVTSATATPNPANHNQLVTVSVNATSVAGAITTATVDVSALGGSSALSLVQSNGTSIYTNSVIVSPSTPVIPQTLTVTLVDSANNSTTIPITLSVVGLPAVWNGNASPDNTWANTLNWVNGYAPEMGDLVYFAGNNQLTPDMNGNYSISGLTFNSGAGGFNITSGASTLTLTGGVTNNSANVESVSVPVVLNDRPVFNTAAGNVVVSGVVSEDDTNGLVKTGAGTLYLTGANTYTGPTTVGGGALYISTAIQGNGSGAYESFTVNDGATFGVINNGALGMIEGLTLGNTAGPTTVVFTNLTANNVVVSGGGAASVMEVYGDSGGILTLNGNCTVRLANTNGLAVGNEYGLFYTVNPVFNHGAAFQFSPPAGMAGYMTNDTANDVIGLVVTSMTAPVAAFSGTPTNGLAPLQVVFTNSSTGSYTNSVWNFGDGHSATNSTGANVTNTYAATGGYTVSLTVSGAGGVSSLTNTAYIVATTPAPVAGFSGTPTNGFAPLPAVFTDGSSGNITNWAWNFGDGHSVTNSSAISVTNSYAAAGSYTVSLTVSGPGGSSTNTKTAYVVVSPRPSISKTVLANGSLVLSGTNGPAGVQYRILTTTNIATALTNWVPVWTNVFGSDGSYGYTNTAPTNNASFFLLISP